MRAATSSAEYLNEEVRFKIFEEKDDDNFFQRHLKIFLVQTLSTLKQTVIHTRSLRKYITLKEGKLKSDKNLLRHIVNEVNKDVEAISVIDTNDGVFVTGVNIESLNINVYNAVTRWYSDYARNGKRRDKLEHYYKHFFRLNFLLGHLWEVYSDKHNIYQAAYVDNSYALRALLTFILQVVSYMSLFATINFDVNIDKFSTQEKLLLGCLILHHFLNLPSKFVTSSIANNIVLLNIFWKMRKVLSCVFTLMDVTVNTFFLILTPFYSIMFLANADNFAELLLNSIGVMYVCSLDDEAITKHESNRLLHSQEKLVTSFLSNMTLINDPNFFTIIPYLPWIESLALSACTVISVLYVAFS